LAEVDRSEDIPEDYQRIIVILDPAAPIALRLQIGTRTIKEAIKDNLLVLQPSGYHVAMQHAGWPSEEAAEEARLLGYKDAPFDNAMEVTMAVYRAISPEHVSSVIGTTIDRTDTDSPHSSITSHGTGTCKTAASVHQISPASRPSDNIGVAGAAVAAAPDGSTPTILAVRDNAGAIPPDAGAGAGLKLYDSGSDLDDRKPAAVETVSPVPVAHRVAKAKSAPKFDPAPVGVIDLCCDSSSRNGSIVDLCSSHSDLDDRKPAAAGAAVHPTNGANNDAADDTIDLRSISDNSSVRIINVSKPATAAPKHSTKSPKHATKSSPTAKKSKAKKSKAKHRNGASSSTIGECIDLCSISEYSSLHIINDSKPATAAPKHSTKSPKHATKSSPTAKKSKAKKSKAKHRNGASSSTIGECIDLCSISEYSSLHIINDSKPATAAPKHSTKSPKHATKSSPTAKKIKAKKSKAKHRNGASSSIIGEYRLFPLPYTASFEIRMNHKVEWTKTIRIENPENVPFVTYFGDYYQQCIAMATKGKQYHQSVCSDDLPRYYVRFCQCKDRITIRNFTKLGIHIKDRVKDAIEAMLQELHFGRPGGIDHAMGQAENGHF